MIKEIKHLTALQGNGDILHRIILRSEDCDQFGERARYIKNNMLRAAVDNPDLLGYKFYEFYSLKLEHFQGAWQLTASIIEPKEEK
jgi:hypothetical protein